jgi:hypothetical protein
MSAPALERLLAVLYTDEATRRAFIADPCGVASALGLDPAATADVERMDPDALELAARSYAAKRASHARKRDRWWLRLF